MNVVIEVLTDVLNNMLTTVALGVCSGVLVGVKVVTVTSALIAFELVVHLTYLFGVKSADWAEAVIAIDASMDWRVGECIDTSARV